MRCVIVGVALCISVFCCVSLESCQKSVETCIIQCYSLYKKALDFLAKPETAELPVGRYELDGDNIFVLIQDQTTAPVENKRAESHRNYIDIQYLFTGKEVQGYAPLLPGVTGEEPAGKDNIFYADVENEQFVTLHPGEFTVYFTNDIHRPNCTMDEPVNIHKAVVKIKESLIK